MVNQHKASDKQVLNAMTNLSLLSDKSEHVVTNLRLVRDKSKPLASQTHIVSLSRLLVTRRLLGGRCLQQGLCLYSLQV